MTDACRDDKEQLWASVLFGLPGFINAHPEKVELRPAHRIQADPAVLDAGGLLGTYAIDLQNRQRFRTNGSITHWDGDSLTLGVRVAFSSCPKFIQGELFCTLLY